MNFWQFLLANLLVRNGFQAQQHFQTAFTPLSTLPHKSTYHLQPPKTHSNKSTQEQTHFTPIHEYTIILRPEKVTVQFAILWPPSLTPRPKTFSVLHSVLWWCSQYITEIRWTNILLVTIRILIVTTEKQLSPTICSLNTQNSEKQQTEHQWKCHRYYTLLGLK